jgi:hypothetical protein
MRVRAVCRGVAGILGVFTGLCALFAATVTGYHAWRDHVETGWPATSAQIEHCEVREYSRRSKSLYIRCDIRYTADGQSTRAQVHSRSIPNPDGVVWQSSDALGVGDLQAWVDEHAAGSTLSIHHDPDSPATAVLLETDMPLGGSQLPNDLKVLRLFAILCVTLLGVAIALRPRAATP